MTGGRTRNLIPFVHIAEVALFDRLHELLIRAQGPHERAGRPDWARARERRHAANARARASAPIERGQTALLFYLYLENLAAARDHLEANGVPVGETRDASPRPDARDGPQPPRRLVPDGGRDRVALPACRESCASVRSRSCPADADTPPDPRFASYPRADAPERRLVRLLPEAVRQRRRNHEAGQHRIHGRLARRPAP